MRYSAVIRTLGKGGGAYQRTLDSLMAQTLRPEAILVYIAEGYDLPVETVGVEKYIPVPKGMVAQRSLKYEEVETEFILFLDDDVYLPENGVEVLYRELTENEGQVIAPCTFDNHKASLKNKIVRTLTGREVCRLGESRWAFKVLRTAGFSYLNNPGKPVYESQSNAGNCFLCGKEDFLSIRFEEEGWLDRCFYAFPDDQVMFYKMHTTGLRVLTSFDSGIVHLDAGSTMTSDDDKVSRVIFSEYRNKLVFWHRFIFGPERSPLLRLWSVLAIGYALGIQAAKHSLLHLLGKKRQAKAFFDGLKDGWDFIHSQDYYSLPPIR